MLLPPSSHHDFIMVDILPDVKVSAIKNQKQTRNSTRLTLGVLLAASLVSSHWEEEGVGTQTSEVCIVET